MKKRYTAERYFKIRVEDIMYEFKNRLAMSGIDSEISVFTDSKSKKIKASFTTSSEEEYDKASNLLKEEFCYGLASKEVEEEIISRLSCFGKYKFSFLIEDILCINFRFKDLCKEFLKFDFSINLLSKVLLSKDDNSNNFLIPSSAGNILVVKYPKKEFIELVANNYDTSGTVLHFSSAMHSFTAKIQIEGLSHLQDISDRNNLNYQSSLEDSYDDRVLDLCGSYKNYVDLIANDLDERDIALILSNGNAYYDEASENVVLKFKIG